MLLVPEPPQRKEMGTRATATEIRALAPGTSDRGTHGFTVLSAGESMGPPPFAWWSQFHSCSVGGAMPGATGEKPGELTPRTSLKWCSPEPPWDGEGGCSSQLVYFLSRCLCSLLSSPLSSSSNFTVHLCICRFLHPPSESRGEARNLFFFFLSHKPRCF